MTIESLVDIVPDGNDVSTPDNDVSPGIVLVCIAAVVGCSCLLIATNTSLIGDGPYYLLRAIQTGQPYQLAGRQGVNLVREGPLLLARARGITNTHVLTVFQSIGFVAFPAVVWIIAIIHSRRSRVRFTLVALSCGLCLATLFIFSVSELALALPLVVLASLLVTQSTPWSGPNAALAAISTALLFFSHESIAPSAVLLAAMAVLRIKARLGSIDTKVSIGVAILSMAVLFGAMWTIVFWPNKNANNFLNFSQSIVLLVMGAAFLVGWAVLYGRVPDAQGLRWVLLSFAAVLTALGIRAGIHAGPAGAYQARSVCVVVVVVLQILLLADWIRLQRTDETDPALGLSTGAARAAAVFLVAVMIIPMVCAVRWSTVMGDFRSTITRRSGVVSVANVPTPMAKRYLTSWTNTSLSVVLRSSSTNAVVENTGPLNPFSIDSAEQQLPAKYLWGH